MIETVHLFSLCLSVCLSCIPKRLLVPGVDERHLWVSSSRCPATKASAATCPSLNSKTSTCQSYPNCRDRPLPVHCRRALRYELYPPHARSNCLHEQKTARRPRQCPLLDDLSHFGVLGVQNLSELTGYLPNYVVIRLADRHNAGNGIRTDWVDRIDPAAVGVLQKKDDARPARPAPIDTRSSHSESIPHDTVRRAVSRLVSQIAA